MIKAGPEDKSLAVDILVSAFDPYTENNSINRVIKPGKGRRRRIAALMAYFFDNAILTGEVLLSDDRRACLMYSFPLRKKTSLKTIWMDIRLAWNCVGISRALKVMKRQRYINQFTPDEPYIRPLIFGVRNEFVGTGVAARFMLEIQQEYRDNKYPVFLDTASRKTAGLYEKFGFRITHTDHSEGFPVYLMRLN